MPKTSAVAAAFLREKSMADNLLGEIYKVVVFK
jgi:hypothetical protein